MPQTHPERAAPAGLRPVVAVFMAGLCFLGVWTVGAQIAAFGAWPFATLYGVLAAAVLAGILGSRLDVSAVFASERMRLPAVAIRPRAAAALDPPTLILTALLAAGFVATAAIQYKTSNFLPLWALAIAAAAIALARGPRNGAAAVIATGAAGAEGPGPSPARGFVLVALILLGFYFLTSVPDADDSLFLSFATGAVRERGAIHAGDAMLGLPGIEFIKSTYRLESYQLLAAIIADAGGLPVILAAHAVLPALLLIWTAAVFVLIHHALFRSAHVVTILFHLAFLIALDGALQSYGYHAIPRFFQGKGPFLTTMVPLIAFLTVSALRDDSRAALALLAVAVTAGIGLTANGLYAGPLTAALAGFPFLFGAPGTRLRPFRLIAIVIYPAALAGYVLLFDPLPSGVGHLAFDDKDRAAGGVGGAFWGIFGSPYMHAAGLVLIFLGAAAALAGAALRPVSVYVLGLLLVVLNPFLWETYSRVVTGGNNHRLFWAVPLPLVLAVVAGLAWQTRRLPLRAVVLAVIAVLLAAPGSILYKVTPGPSLLKVPQPEYALARALNALTAEDAVILAPEEIAAWIPTLDDARPVVEARILYLPQRRGQFTAAELMPRIRLFLFWTDETAPAPPPEFADDLAALAVSAVVVDAQRPGHAAALPALTALGFAETGSAGRYRLWSR